MSIPNSNLVTADYPNGKQQSDPSHSSLPLRYNQSTGALDADAILALQLSGLSSANSIDCTTEAQIRAAFTALVAVGGGVIKIHGRITLSASLPMASNIIYLGDGYSLIYTQYPDSGSATLDTTKGTVLIGNGTFPAFTYNTSGLTLAQATTLYGAPGPAAASTNFSNAALTNTGVINIGLKNFSIGIQAGAQYRMSFLYSTFNVCATDCTQWGFWIENFQHCDNCQFYGFNNTLGNVMFAASGAGYLAPGNSYFNAVLGSVKQGVQNAPIRNVVLAAYNGSAFGSMAITHLQGNRFSQISSTQAATMSNGSPNIGVTDLTYFAVGMPVTFSATINGFTVNWIYFVLSVSGASGAGTITVGNYQPSLASQYRPTGYVNDVPFAGTAINAAGNTAVNIISQGFPCIEVVGLDNTSIVASLSVLLLDAEGGGTTKTVFQNCTSMQVCVPATTIDGTSTVEVVTRNAQGILNISSAGAARCDIDGYSTLFTAGNTTSVGQTLPLGVYQTPPLGLGGGNGLQALSLNLKRNNIGDPTIGYNRRGNDTIEINQGIQLTSYAYPTSGTGFSTNQGPVQIFNSASGTNTLPVITEVNLGWVCYYYNASQSGVATINVSSGQLINRQYSTIQVPSEGSVCLVAISYAYGGGSGYGWMILGSTSPYVPYTDSSGTPGNVTHQTGRGMVAIAAAGTSITVTNPNVTTASQVLVNVATNDATAVIKNIVAAAGSFTVNMNAAVTGTTRLNYLIVQ